MRPHQLHIPLFILAIFVTILTIGLYFYTVHAVKASFAKAALAKSVVASQTRDSEEAKSLVSMFEKTKKERESLYTFFIPVDKEISFIETIESVGNKAGSNVKISSVASSDGENTKDNFGVITANVEVEGSWASVMTTLKLLELLPFQSSLANIRLEGTSVGDGKSSRKGWRLSAIVNATTLK